MNQDDPHSSIETLLRGVPLREPGDDLDDRINAAFAEIRPNPFRRIGLYAAALAACALIAIGVRFYLPKTQPIASVKSSHPIHIEREISRVYDDGIVASTGNADYQQFRRRTVREIWVVDPATHAKLQMTIPTEQVLIQKVEAY